MRDHTGGKDQATERAEHALAQVLTAAGAVLEQCRELIDGLPEEVYTAESRVLVGGTVGRHVRHTLDHYRAQIEALEAGDPVDYDHRARGGAIETSREAATREIERLREALSAARDRAGDTPVRIRVMVSADGSEAQLDSTFAREVAFATHHAVHHQAIMRAIAVEHGYDVAPDFGKAPSTLNYERSA